MLWQIILILLLCIPILAIVLDSQVGKALASRLERGQLPSGLSEESGERIRYLEGEVDRLGEEVERLSDESQFLHKLLADRPKEHGTLPPGDPGGE